MILVVISIVFLADFINVTGSSIDEKVTHKSILVFLGEGCTLNLGRGTNIISKVIRLFFIGRKNFLQL